MYKKLLPKESKQLISGIKLGSILIQFTFLAFPLSMYIVYNKVIASNNPNTIIIILLFLIFILITQLILKTTESIQQNILKVDEEIKNHEDYIKEKFKKENAGQYNITEISNIGQKASSGIQNHISNAYVIFLFIYLGLIATVGKFIVIMPIIFFSINYLVAKKLTEKYEEYNERYKRVYNKKTLLIKEILLKIKTIKGLGVNKLVEEKYHHYTDLANIEKCSSLYSKSLMLKFSMVINIVNIAFILLLGRYLYSLGMLNIEQIITCSLLTMWIARPVAQIFSNLNVKKTKNSNENQQSYISKSDEYPEEQYKDYLQQLETKNIIYYETNSQYSLKDLYLRLNQDYENITYAGHDLSLFYGSVLNNITLYDDDRIEEVKQLIKKFKVDNLITNLPFHYNYVVTGNNDEILTYDLRVSIAIIREIVLKPAVILIDIDANRINTGILNGLSSYAKQHNIKIILLKSKQSINSLIKNITNKTMTLNNNQKDNVHRL